MSLVSFRQSGLVIHMRWNRFRLVNIQEGTGMTWEITDRLGREEEQGKKDEKNRKAHPTHLTHS